MALLTLLNDGSTIEIEDSQIPDNYPDSINFRDVFTGIQDAGNFILDAYGTVNEIRTASDTTAYNRFMQTLSLDTTKSLAQTSAEVEKAKAAATLAKAQGAIPAGTGIVTQSGRFDSIMLIAAIVGVIGVVYTMSKGK